MLIKDLIKIPESVDKGQFVLKLTEGVTKAQETVDNYVVTEQLVECFRDALNFIKGAMESNTSKSSYLHGSFGSGKSHFMAVLNLILRRDPAIGSLTNLASVINDANSWTQGKNFLLVPYHMIGAKNMEAGILGGYADFIREKHPEATVPAIYLVDDLFNDAVNLRQTMGDDKFFAGLNEGGGDGDWGEMEGDWDAERFDAAIAAPPVPESDPNFAPSEPRRDLASALIKNYFQSYENISRTDREAYVSLDAGLSVISEHAQKLGYHGVVLFLDELILWLASHAADLEFMHQEGQKLSKLVEAQHKKAIPLISFVARQRDLGELVGENITGADKLNFGDALKHWEGRFHKITLEDRNLPAIAEARILKPVSDKAREQLAASFEETARMRSEVMNTLLTSKYDKEIFKRVYPFSPALVDTLVGVSSLLQRERTALKVMMLLLVSQRDNLKLGDVLPVGDLFDVIAHGDEAFNQEMAIQFENAKRLYHQKLLPLVESQHGVSKSEVDELLVDDRAAIAFKTDDRLIKTMLLAALVPGVESLKGLNANRLAALNHGTIKTPVPGKEGAEVLRRCREWVAGGVGEIKIGDEQSNPTITLKLSGVDTDRIIEQARHEDSQGNRQRLIRRLLFEEMGVEDADEFFLSHDFAWRNTDRWCEIGFGNIRSLPPGSLEAGEDNWKVLIDFPFDEAGYGPQDDIAKLDEYTATHPEGTRTVAWLPSFFSQSAQNELGMLVILEHILIGERFDGFASILPFEDRHVAKALLENQRSQLRQRVKQHLEAAYGIDRQSRGSVDTSHELNEHFVSLVPDFDPQPPAAANLSEAMQKLIDQALSRQFPAHPVFGSEPKGANLKKVHEEVQRATEVSDGRIEIDDKKRRPLLKGIAEPLKLGEMHETVFLLSQHWKNHFEPKIHEVGGVATVGQLRQWMNDPSPMGLPKQVENVVILAFAAQTNRTLYEHGVPVKMDSTYTKLEDQLELRTWQGPPEEDWNIATTRAASVFGLAPSQLYSAANVGQLTADIGRIGTEYHVHCQKLLTTLKERSKKFELDSDDTARIQTATATLELLDQLQNAQGDQVISLLASARIATSDTAMGKSLKTSTELVQRIDATNWGVFEDIDELSAEHKPKAKAIRDSVREALATDEYTIGLSAVIKKAQADATNLLGDVAKSKKPAAPAVTPNLGGTGSVPPPSPSAKVISSNSQQGLAGEEALELLDSIKSQLSENEKRKLNVSWSVIEEAGE